MNRFKFHVSQVWYDRLKAGFYLVLLPIVVAVILILGYYNNKSQNTRASKQTRINAQHIKVLHNSLAEACHATTVQYSIITSLILYLQGGPNANNYRTQALINSLTGQAADLEQLTACRRIARP